MRIHIAFHCIFCVERHLHDRPLDQRAASALISNPPNTSCSLSRELSLTLCKEIVSVNPHHGVLFPHCMQHTARSWEPSNDRVSRTSLGQRDCQREFATSVLYMAFKSFKMVLSFLTFYGRLINISPHLSHGRLSQTHTTRGNCHDHEAQHATK